MTHHPPRLCYAPGRSWPHPPHDWEGWPVDVRSSDPWSLEHFHCPGLPAGHMIDSIRRSLVPRGTRLSVPSSGGAGPSPGTATRVSRETGRP